MGGHGDLVAVEYHLDVYPADDPRDGTRLVRLSADNALQSADVRDVIGVGSGRFSLRATTTEAGFLTPQGEQYIRVVRDDGSTELVVDGFWTNEIRYAAAVRDETKRLVVGGAGRMAYLARAVMAPHTYLSSDIDGSLPDGIHGMDPFDRLWRLYEQGPFAGGDMLGAALYRVIYEAQHFRSGSSTYTHKHADGISYTDNHDDDRRRSAIPDLVMGFDAFEDSDGNAWTMPSGQFQASVGENVLQVVRRLMEAGLYVEMDPDTFELRAWEGTDHRRDRTGGAWGANVVRLQAPTDGTIATGNIKSESERLISSHIRRTTIWAGGGGDVYGFADTASGTPWEGYAPSDVEDVTALDNLADTQMSARSEAGDVLSARLKLGQAPASGTYLPWEHVKLDDLVTVHTGTDEWDYNEAEYPVAALRIHLRDGGDWDAWADLGASFEVMAERRFAIESPPAAPMPLKLCTTTLATGETADLYEEWTWDSGAETPANPGDISIGSGASVWGSGDEGTANPGANGAESSSDYSALEHDTGSQDVAAVAGTVYRVTGYFWKYNSDVRIEIRFFNSSSTLLQTTTLVHSASWPTAWTPWTSPDVTAPTGATNLQLRARTGASGGVGATGWIDQIRIYEITAGGETFALDEYTGTSRQAARCDHGHDHNDLLNRNAAGAHSASAVTFDPTESELTADTVQDAIDELAGSFGGGVPLRWEAVTNGEDIFVWEGDDLVHEWKAY